MKSWMNRITRLFKRYGQPAAELNRSRLVGMYLAQTNTREELAPDYNQTRQRKNGRFSHTRERL